MEDIRPQINDFLKKCSELKNCKFIMAPTKIRLTKLLLMVCVPVPIC